MIRLWSKDDSFYLGNGKCMRAQLLMRYKEGDITWFKVRINNLAGGKYDLAYNLFLLMNETSDGNPHVIRLCKKLHKRGIRANDSKVYFQLPRCRKYNYMSIYYGFIEHWNKFHFTSFHDIIRSGQWKYLQFVLTTFQDIHITIRNLNHNIFAYYIFHYWPFLLDRADINMNEDIIACRILVKSLIDKYCSFIPINVEVPHAILCLSTIQGSTLRPDGMGHVTTRVSDNLLTELQTIYNCCKRKYIPADGYLHIIPRDIYNMIVDYY